MLRNFVDDFNFTKDIAFFFTNTQLEDDALPHKKRLIQITRQLIQQYDDREFDEHVMQVILAHSSQLI